MRLQPFMLGVYGLVSLCLVTWNLQAQPRPAARPAAPASAARTAATAGLAPATATSTAGRVTSDWKTAQVTFQALVPVGFVASQWQVPVNGTEPLVLRQTGSELVVSGSADSFRAALVPDTRSIRLENLVDSAATFRLDLPGLDLGTTVVPIKYPNFPEGLVLAVPVVGLRPDFAVYCAIQTATQATPTEPFQLSNQKGNLPRVSDAITSAVAQGAMPAGTYVRLIVPYLPDPQAKATYFITVLNSDGSRSRTLQITRTGDVIDKVAQTTQSYRLAPLDLPAVVPNVELLTASVAEAQLKQAGFGARFIDLSTGQEMTALQAGLRSIARQGLPAGSSARRGEVLLLGLGELQGATIPRTTSDQLAGVSDGDPPLSGGLLGGGLLGAAHDELAMAHPNEQPGVNPDLGLEEHAAGHDHDDAVTDLGLLLEESNTGNIDTGDQLGFVDPVDQGGLINGSLGLGAGGLLSSGPVNGGVVPPAGGLVNPGGGLIDNGQLTDGGGGLADPGAGGLIPGSEAPGGLVNGPTLPDNGGGGLPPPGGGCVPVNPDPGLVLDPTHDDMHNVVDAILKITLIALLDKIDNGNPGGLGGNMPPPFIIPPPGVIFPPPGALPPPDPNLPPPGAPGNVPGGPLAQALVHLLQTLEGKLQQDAINNGSVTPDLLQQALTLLVTDLKVDLNPAQQQQLLVDWQLQLLNQGSLVDSNNNNLIGDDVATWMLDWLVDQGVYNPANDIQLVADGSGGVIAILGNQVVPNWIQNNPIPLVLAVDPNSGLQVVPPLNNLGLFDPSIFVIPSGQLVVVNGEKPNRVRVPAVADLDVNGAVARLKNTGLKLANTANIFSTDKVVGSLPEAGEWVDLGSPVELQSLVKVPSVLQKNVQQASAILKAHDLQLTYPGKIFNSDVVVGQAPAAGEYVAHGTPINLDARLVVPDVTNKGLTVAAKTLQNYDLGWLFAEKNAALLNQAIQQGPGLGSEGLRVTAQNPVAGSLAKHGQQVGLGVGVLIPNVNGQSIAGATDQLRGTGGDLQITVEQPYARTDLVYSQNPVGDRVYPIGQAVNLTPGLLVPGLQGLSSNQADASLRQAGLNGRVARNTTQETMDLNLVGQSLVGSQSQQANTIVPRGTTIDLTMVYYRDGGTYVPNVIGLSRGQAFNAISNAGLNPQAGNNGGGFGGGTVNNQAPGGGQRVRRGSTVTVYFPQPQPQPNDPENPQNPNQQAEDVIKVLDGLFNPKPQPQFR